MLHVHKVRLGSCPSYVEDPFLDQWSAAAWLGDYDQIAWLPEAPTRDAMSRLLNADHMPRRHKGGSSPIAGTQLTLSAPKCVSVAGLVAGDQRVITAHVFAVQQVFHYLAEHVACRVTRGGITQHQVSSFILGAMFHRFQSRVHDPHLHTHLIILNSGIDETGSWKTIDNGIFREESRLLGNLYQSTLGLCMHSYGYDVDYGDSGLVRLPVIGRDLCERLSTRQAQMRQCAKKITGRELKEISRPGQISFAINTTPKDGYPSYSQVLSAWMYLTAADLIMFHVPVTRSERITWHSSEEAALAIRAAYDDMRSPAGGVKFSALISEVYETAGGTFSVLDLLETMGDKMTTCYAIEGFPATVFDGGEDLARYWERRESKDAAASD